MMASPPSPFAYSAPKASPLALRALRDLAIVSEQLREMQDAVRPAAEQVCTPVTKVDV